MNEWILAGRSNTEKVAYYLCAFCNNNLIDAAETWANNAVIVLERLDTKLAKMEENV